MQPSLVLPFFPTFFQPKRPWFPVASFHDPNELQLPTVYYLSGVFLSYLRHVDHFLTLRAPLLRKGIVICRLSAFFFFFAPRIPHLRHLWPKLSHPIF